MMQYQINLRPEAEDDLNSIYDWSVLNFGKETADKTMNMLLRRIRRLESFPYSGSTTQDDYLNKEGYRMIIAGRYAAFYKVIENTVVVYRVVDTRRQYTLLFYE